jgi:hypothetical protein
MQTVQSWHNLLEHFATEAGKVAAFFATKEATRRATRKTMQVLVTLIFDRPWTK